MYDLTIKRTLRAYSARINCERYCYKHLASLERKRSGVIHPYSTASYIEPFLFKLLFEFFELLLQLAHFHGQGHHFMFEFFKSFRIAGLAPAS